MAWFRKQALRKDLFRQVNGVMYEQQKWTSI
jgi:hypothetical protein